MPDELAPRRRGVPDGTVTPFPRARFEQFLAAQKIISKDAGLIPFTILGSQQYLIDEMERGVSEGITSFVVLKARGGGISTILLLLDIFWASEYPGTLGAFVTQDEAARDQFRAQIEVVQATMPRHFRVSTPTNNRMLLIYTNSSLFRFLVAGTRNSTSNKLGRSGHSNYRHMTESAFYASGEDIKAMDQAISDIHPHRLYIEETTANGFNHFEERWQIAKESPAQRAIFIGWWRDERNEFGEEHPLYLRYMPSGRQTALSPLERKRVALVRKLYDYAITAGQIAWYRYHLENKCKGDQATADQEMPWTEDDAFQSTGAKFCSDESLTRGMREARQILCMPFVFRVSERFADIGLLNSTIERAQLKIWEKPSRFGSYVIGHDPNMGLAHGRNPDNAAIAVCRCYADACVQVAEFCSSSFSTHQQAWVLCVLAGLYDDVMVNLELNGPGAAVFQEMKVIREYTAEMPADAHPELRNCLAHMRNFLYRKIDSLGGGVVNQWRGSHDLNINLLGRFKDGFEKGEMVVRSLAALEEMRRLERDEETDNIAAAGAFHDDRVRALALAYFAHAEWRVRAMKGKGMTLAYAARQEQAGGSDPVDGLVRRFLQNAKIRTDSV